MRERGAAREDILFIVRAESERSDCTPHLAPKQRLPDPHVAVDRDVEHGLVGWHEPPQPGSLDQRAPRRQVNLAEGSLGYLGLPNVLPARSLPVRDKVLRERGDLKTRKKPQRNAWATIRECSTVRERWHAAGNGTKMERKWNKITTKMLRKCYQSATKMLVPLQHTQ